MLQEFSPKLKISEVNLRFIKRFDDFLRIEKGKQDGGRENKHKNMRAVILDMIRHDIAIKNPYTQFKMPKAKIREVYLESDELDIVRELRSKFELGSSKRISLQMYLFACYTGLRLSDVQDLKWSHIDLEKNRIVKKQIKTKDMVTVVITEWARTVLLEFSNSKTHIGTDKVVFENQCTSNTINKHQKEIIAMAGIKKHISFHSSRHTFGKRLYSDVSGIKYIPKELLLSLGMYFILFQPIYRVVVL